VNGQLAESRHEFSEPGVRDIHCNVDNYHLSRASQFASLPGPYDDGLFVLHLESTKPSRFQNLPVVLHNEIHDTNIADTIASASSSELFASCNRFPLAFFKSSSEPFAFCDRDVPLVVPVGTRIGTPKKPSLHSIPKECDNPENSGLPEAVHCANSGSIQSDEHGPWKKSIKDIVDRHHHHGSHLFHHYERQNLGVRAHLRRFFRPSY
jgi:hypothetical protein